MTMQVKDGAGVTKHIAVNGDGSSGDPFTPVHASSSTGAQKRRLDRYLDTNGDGTGTKNAVGDYSSATEIFYIQPPAGVVYRVARMLVFVQDVGTFDSGSYGNGITLASGIEIRVADDIETISDMTDGNPVKVNPHWARLCYDTAHSSYGSGNESLAARWTFTKAGPYIRLDGDNNERLEVVLNDNFSGLVDQAFLVQGYIE